MSNNPRYGTNSQNTSKYMTDLLNEFNKMPRGVFNETRRKIFDVSPYAIVPVEVFEMLPNSEAYLSYDVQMISKNPTVKRILSSMNVELRTYQLDYNDSWEGWNNFITKGRTGKVTKSIPYVDYSLGSNDVTTSLPYNPAFYMSLSPSVFLARNDNGEKFTQEYNEQIKPVANLQDSGLTGISTLAALKASTAMRQSALPFVMYNKVCKKYQSPNLLQDNPHWYPENENHDMILPYNATGAVTTSDYDNPTKAFVTGTSIVDPSAVKSLSDTYESYPWLNCLQYSQRKGDMFNTGSPFPDLIRGDMPTLEVLNASADFTNAVFSGNTPRTTFSYLGFALGDKQLGLVWNKTSSNQNLQNGYGDDNKFNNINSNLELNKNNEYQSYLLNALNKNTVSGIEFSMRQWRYLATMSVMKERMALTDGSYNELIKAMFGHNPRWHNHDVRYCGGSSQSIVFSEVVNQTESDTAPLGTTGGRAVSATQNHQIHVKSDDFGMFMTVLVITPDEYYSQGVDKMFSRLENAEQYFPILNNLSPDSTLNKELFVSGTNATDDDVFNYQERFAYYKSRRNQVSGLMALPISKVGDIGAYLQNRLFATTPDFNFEFNLGKLTDNEKAIFASTNQAQFCCCIGSNMRYIAPIPEDSRPSDMGISY